MTEQRETYINNFIRDVLFLFICCCYRQFGWEARFADADDMSAVEAEIDENTKAVFCEVIANPGGVIVDLEALVEVAHRHGLPVIVDNTSVRLHGPCERRCALS